MPYGSLVVDEQRKQRGFFACARQLPYNAFNGVVTARSSDMRLCIVAPPRAAPRF